MTKNNGCLSGEMNKDKNGGWVKSEGRKPDMSSLAVKWVGLASSISVSTVSGENATCLGRVKSSLGMRVSL